MLLNRTISIPLQSPPSHLGDRKITHESIFIRNLKSVENTPQPLLWGYEITQLPQALTNERQQILPQSWLCEHLGENFALRIILDQKVRFQFLFPHPYNIQEESSSIPRKTLVELQAKKFRKIKILMERDFPGLILTPFFDTMLKNEGKGYIHAIECKMPCIPFIHTDNSIHTTQNSITMKTPFLHGSRPVTVKKHPRITYAPIISSILTFASTLPKDIQCVFYIVGRKLTNPYCNFQAAKEYYFREYKNRPIQLTTMQSDRIPYYYMDFVYTTRWRQFDHYYQIKEPIHNGKKHRKFSLIDWSTTKKVDFESIQKASAASFSTFKTFFDKIQGFGLKRVTYRDASRKIFHRLFTNATKYVHNPQDITDYFRFYGQNCLDFDFYLNGLSYPISPPKLLPGEYYDAHRQIMPDDIILGFDKSNTPVTIPLADLTMNMVIAGIPGSGKTPVNLPYRILYS